ncbi:MAG: ATP-binding protein [Ginsengibacter sp.]
MSFRPHAIITTRPFRNPHHTASNVALAGGGTFPVPGEISKAHNGVLFLDELPEFNRSAIEVLRQPLEERRTLISRTSQSVTFPASFLLIASMNPCLCGFHNQPGRKCTCSKRALYWYRRKISGPLLDRFDLHINAEPVVLEDLLDEEEAECSASIRKRVVKAREQQSSRYQNQPLIFCNAQMRDEDVKKICIMEPFAKRYLLRKMEDFPSSARSYMRILKISRTIADLAVHLLNSTMWLKRFISEDWISINRPSVQSQWIVKIFIINKNKKSSLLIYLLYKYNSHA